jgi:hypothetical protein
VHQYKITEPLIVNNQDVVLSDDKGTIFFGDGNWGVFEESCPAGDQHENLEWNMFFSDVKYGEYSFNVWILDYNCKEGLVSYYALDPNNKTISNSTRY